MALMCKSQLNEQSDVRVVEPVVHILSGAAGGDQAQGAKDAQMLRDAGIAYAQDCSNIAGAELLMEEEVNDLGPRRVGQGAKELGQDDIRPIRSKQVPGLSRLIGVDTVRLTEIGALVGWEGLREYVCTSMSFCHTQLPTIS
jgi:hypothetical protein